MALVGDAFYVADSDGLLVFPYIPGATRIGGPGRVVSPLPAGRINHHWNKSLVASPDGRRLYVGVGSNSNAMENGVAAEQGRASVWEIDPAGGTAQVFAGGLRNPVGLAFEPSSGTLWAAVNERDELGSDLVPDYTTSVRRGGFFRQWGLRGAARLVELQSAGWLQGDLRPLHRWPPGRNDARRAGRIPRREWPGDGAAGWGGNQ